VEHLRIMLTVPGIASAQRFKTDSPGYSPSLALYTVASAEVFRNPYYLSVRGMGEWLPLVPKQHYHRNLFDGLDTAPDVAEDSVLIVADRDRPALGPQGITLTWLRTVGIDLSTPYRGIAVFKRAAADSLAGVGGIGVYRPVTRRAVQR
ncbi:MAG: hypothetical protein ACREVR_10145, partial [Burkholderiales bacterium]